jgi:hypothetical protein
VLLHACVGSSSSLNSPCLPGQTTALSQDQAMIRVARRKKIALKKVERLEHAKVRSFSKHFSSSNFEVAGLCPCLWQNFSLRASFLLNGSQI